MPPTHRLQVVITDQMSERIDKVRGGKSRSEWARDVLAAALESKPAAPKRKTAAKAAPVKPIPAPGRKTVEPQFGTKIPKSAS